MNQDNPRIVVTPPPICNSSKLVTELTRYFPNAIFNSKGRYLTESELIEFLKDSPAAIVGRDPITEKVLRELPNLKILAKYGVGLDTVDEAAMAMHSVTLGWEGGVNKRSVAELTLCFMLGLCHNIFSTGFSLKQGQWFKDGGRDLYGKTVGIIGCGHVGREVVRLLQSFACRILINDILDKTEYCQAVGVTSVGINDLLCESDIVSLHVPLTRLTQGMISAEKLGRMKKSAYLVNTSRGEVVDQNALKYALQKKVIAGAALDVFAEEPPNDMEFLALENLMVSPHIAGNTVEAVEAMGRAAIAHLVKYFKK